MVKNAHNSIVSGTQRFFAPQKTAGSVDHRVTHAAGFSTLELLIAFAVMTLGITAVIMVAFGNQSIAVDTELAQRGLYLAEQKLEEAGAATFQNFDAVSEDLTPIAYNSVFDTQTTISDTSECAKRITVTTFWDRGPLRELHTSLSSIFVSPEYSDALGHDCVTEESNDEWDNPATFVDENIPGGQPNATALDVVDDTVYLIAHPTNASKEDLFIYDFDESGPTLTELGKLNTDQTLAIGLYDIAVASTSPTDIYAFAASASTTAQFRVIDIHDPLNPTELYSLALPGVNSLGSYPEGRTIYYYDDRVYIGTRETNGPEFHIFDVSGLPLTPPTHLGSIELTHTIKDIMVRGDYAYLATTDNNHELMVIDISNPGSMTHPDVSGLGFDASGNDDGSAVYATGQKVYLGRTRTSAGTGDDLYILNGADVRDGVSITDGALGKQDVGLSNNSYTAGMVVRGDLIFLSLDNPIPGLIIYNISDPTNISLPAACSEFNFSENSVGLAMDGRYVFSANRSNDEIRIIEDLDIACPI